MLDRRIVIALERDAALARDPHHDVDDRHRVRAVADEVAEQCVAIDALRACVCETRVERLEIGVNVGQQREAHGAGPPP